MSSLRMGGKATYRHHGVSGTNGSVASGSYPDRNMYPTILTSLHLGMGSLGPKDHLRPMRVAGREYVMYTTHAALELR